MRKNYFLSIALVIVLQSFSQSFTKTLISNNQANGAFGLIEYDINGDGSFDLIGTSKNDNSVLYFINNGSGNFTQHVIDTNLPGAAFAFAGDLDGDSDLDFAAVGSSKLVWYENDGSFNFTSHDIANLTDPNFVGIFDADGDGDNDIGVAITGENYITAFFNDGSASFSRLNAISVNSPKMFHGGDFNADGTPDILAPSFGNGTIKWYYFNGLYFTSGGTVTTGFNGVWGTEGVDMDGDGDYDVVAAAYTDNTIAWFENDGSGTNFTRHDIDTSLNHAMYTRTIDFDYDGDKDIVATGNGTGGSGSEVVLYTNDGNQNFTKHVLDNTSQGPAWFAVQDFYGNGVRDIAFAADLSNEFDLLIQQTSAISNPDINSFIITSNPGHEQVVLSSEKPIKNIILFDLAGRKLMKTSRQIINLTHIPRGTYIIKAVFEDGSLGTKKLIVD